MEFPSVNVMTERVHEYVFQVLPGTAHDVYIFIRDWQTLIAGILIVFAARYFFEAMLRSSRITAEAIIHSARVAGDGVKSERPAAAAPEPQVPALALAQAQPQPMLGVPSHLAPAAGAPLGERLDALRNAVRSALAAIPTTGNDIGLKGAALYGRVATFTFDDIDAGQFDKPSLVLFRELQTSVDSLRLDANAVTDARHAWERLVRINKLARELRGRIAPEAAAPLEKAIVKKIG